METYHLEEGTRSFRDLFKDQSTPEEVIRFWCSFVERCSATDLTQKRDRLPAAFGMAQQLLRLMPGNRFLAGLFESHLAEGLLWSVIALKPMKQNSNEVPMIAVLTDFQVPSWSWTSLSLPVICYSHKVWRRLHFLATITQDGVLPLSQGEPVPNAFVVCNRLRVASRLLELEKVLGKATTPTRRTLLSSAPTFLTQPFLFLTHPRSPNLRIGGLSGEGKSTDRLAYFPSWSPYLRISSEGS